MSNQPFDNYMNKGVEYDYIIGATVKVEDISDEIISSIMQLLSDEDFLAIYFKSVALGRVYPKVEYINSKLHFTFGISLVDTDNHPTTKDLNKEIIDFILSLNKNIEQMPKLNIKESDIKMDVITENKFNIDDVDKYLVNEGSVSFSRNNDIQSFKLTSDGIVEKYHNNNLSGTMPFSKLGIIRECKGLFTDGYEINLVGWHDILTEADLNQDKQGLSLLNNTEEVKRDLQQNIQDVDEIQDLKNELEDKIASLYEDNTKSDDYLLVVYTNINGSYVPDVCVRCVNDSGYIIADDVDDAGRYTEDEANKYVEIFNDIMKDTNNYILKAVKLSDIDNLKELYESKEYTTEFPSTETSAKQLNYNELANINLNEILNKNQIQWLQINIGSLDDIIDGFKNFLDDISTARGRIKISLDEYFNELYNTLKGV